MSSHAEDPYLILGVRRGAGKAEVKAAYRRAALQTHPDVNTGSIEAFRRVSDAYETLLNGSSPRHRVASSPRPRRPVRPEAPLEYASATTPSAFHHRVSLNAAEDLFRQAFGGRSVKEVLQDEAASEGGGKIINHGVHANCEGTFNRLLFQAQRLREAAARAAREQSAQRGSSDTPDREVSRTYFTDDAGARKVRVQTVLKWPNGHIEESFVDKPVYTM